VEQLEDRMVPSNFTAATVSDLIADINAANLAGGANTITLTAPTTSPYVLTAVNNTTDGPTGLPVIARGDTLTIVGNGDLLERSSASNFRLLDVASQGALILESLTLQNGSAVGAGVSAEGGALLNKGTLTLNGVTAQDNDADGSEKKDVAGGGIYSSGSLTLEGATMVQNNRAIGGFGAGNAFGGGIYSSGSLTLEGNTVVQNNLARAGGGSNSGSRHQTGGAGGNAFGGGIYVAGGTASLTNVTLSSNTAEGGYGGSGAMISIIELGFVFVSDGGPGGVGQGGGIYVASGTVTLSSDTLSSNTAQGGFGGGGRPSGNGGNGFGGGLYAGGGTISLFNDTVDFNAASGGSSYGGNGFATGSPGIAGNGFGGGLCAGGGTISLFYDTVEFNTASGGSGNVNGQGEGGGLYIDTHATLSLDAFTLANVINNTASTSNNDIFGSYILVP
jgi:hypothetical protein